LTYRDLCGVKLISGLYCRLSAPGRSPAALKGQKAPQFKILPSKCPWTISSGTQRAESPTIQDIAAEVPLDDLQRHSKGRKPHNSRYCRRSVPGRSPAALKGQKAPQFKILPSKCPWTASSGTQAAQERQLPVRGGEREKYGDNKGNSSKKEYKKIFTGSGG